MGTSGTEYKGTKVFQENQRDYAFTLKSFPSKMQNKYLREEQKEHSSHWKLKITRTLASQRPYFLKLARVYKAGPEHGLHSVVRVQSLISSP